MLQKIKSENFLAKQKWIFYSLIMKQEINSYGGTGGLPCFFENSSYNCPLVGLYGYSTEKALHRGIKKELKKSSNRWLIERVQSAGIGYMQGKGAA